MTRAGVGIVEPALDRHLPAHQPRVEDPADDADAMYMLPQARPEHRDDGDDQDEEGEGDHRIDDAAEDRLGEAAGIADAAAPTRRADDERRTMVAKTAICMSIA